MILYNDVAEKMSRTLTGVAGVDSSRHPFIYHYTSVASFKSIIESGAFWASDVSYLNDSKEILYGFGVVCGAIKNAQNDRTRSKEYKYSLDELIKFITKNISVCSVSFCKGHDLLGQWRGYGGIQGVSVGVSSAALSKIENFEVFQVVYEKELQNHMVRQLIEIYTNSYVENIQKFEEDPLEILSYGFVKIAAQYFDRLIAIFKDVAFKEEGEIRAFTRAYDHDSGGNVHFRERGGVLIPYYNMEIDFLDENCLDKIVVGPGPRYELVKTGLDAFLSSKKIKAEVIPSEVALRA